MTTVRSRKAKGRRLQNWVRDTLLKIFSNNGFLDENDIKCAVMGETGADIKLSNTAKIIIRALPRITAISENTVADEGESIVLTVIADGTPPLRYQWKKVGSNSKT